MRYNPDIHNRRSIRLRGYDYRGAGVYFVTVCAFQRECLFGEVMDGEMMLNAFGSVAAECWQSIPAHFPHAVLDAFVVMPNHFHAILHITESMPGTTVKAKTVGAKQGSSASPDSSPGSDGVYGYKTGNSGKGENRGEGENEGEAGEAFASPLRPPPRPPRPPEGTQCGSLGAIIQNFKSVSTRKINRMRNNPGCPVWQRNYFEHIIRNEREMEKVRRYIVENPLKWDLDENNPAVAKLPK